MQDIPFLPPTFTLVFDAGNRCVSARANLASGANPSREDLTFFGGEIMGQTEDGAASAQLPLLIAADSPQPWLRLLEKAAAPRRIHLLFPAACFVDAETQAVLAEFDRDSVTLMADGLPTGEEGVQAFAVDVAHGMNGYDGARLHKFKGPHLATGIGDHALHRQCREAGFHWFEGSWLLHPDAGQGARGTTSRSSLLGLLGLVAGDADSHEIEALLKRDPSLSYQMLKLVNSVSFSLTHKIDNFNQAITLLGRRQLQRWLQLLLFAGHYASDTVSPLLGFAACRAALMEALVEAGGGKQDDKDRAFMVGLFSLLDVLFDAAIADLVLPLNLDDELARAIVGHEGRLGRLLDLCIAAESAPGAALAQGLAELALAPEAFVHAQLRALAWASQVCRDV